jgi:hypothetical protein
VTDIVRHAKQILRDAGYVVIPRERHVVLTVGRSHDRWSFEQLRDNEGYLRYESGNVASQFGIEMLRKGAIYTEDLGLVEDRYERRWTAGIILPK